MDMLGGLFFTPQTGITFTRLDKKNGVHFELCSEARIRIYINFT